MDSPYYEAMDGPDYGRQQRSRNEYDTRISHYPTHPQGQSIRPMHLTPGPEQFNAFVTPRMRAPQWDARRNGENIAAHGESNQRSKRNHAEIDDILSDGLQQLGMGDNGVAVDDAKVKATMQQKNDREKHRLIELAEEEVAEAAAVLEAAEMKRDLLYRAAQSRQETLPKRRYPTEMWHDSYRDFDDF